MIGKIKKMVFGKEYKKSCIRFKKFILIMSVMFVILINSIMEEMKNSIKKKEKKICEIVMKR